MENILRDSRFINTKKKLFLETTSGVRKFVAPNVRPFAFIDSLKNEDLSVKTSSPDFFFLKQQEEYTLKVYLVCTLLVLKVIIILEI